VECLCRFGRDFGTLFARCCLNPKPGGRLFNPSANGDRTVWIFELILDGWRNEYVLVESPEEVPLSNQNEIAERRRVTDDKHGRETAKARSSREDSSEDGLRSEEAPPKIEAIST
jgi:hypothetical protein